MPLMDSNKHFRKRLGKRGIAFSWAPSVLAQQNGKGMGMAAPERVRFLAAGKRHASAHCTVTPAPTPPVVVLLSVVVLLFPTLTPSHRSLL